MGDSPIGARDAGAPLRLATAPVNWNNNDIPNWRPLTPFPAILDRMREAGYDATEYDASFGTDVEVLVREAETRGMTWCGSYQWVDFVAKDRIAALAPTLERLAAIDCRNLIVADALRPERVAIAGRVPEDGSASLSDPQIQDLAGGVHRLAEVAERHGIAVRYHNHVGSWIETPRELEALMAHLDVHLCFDTGHYAYGGGDAAAFIRDHHDRIGYLHLKDVDAEGVRYAREHGLTFIDALKRYVFSPIGEGIADIPSILDVLTTTGFDGWVVVEQDTCAGDATETARADRDFIAAWLDERAPLARSRQGESAR